MQTVYHNADEKVLIQSDKDTDGRATYLVVDGNVVNGQPSVKSVGIVHDSVAYEEREPV
jgi:hypothetical protein